jgi:SAM-dependent methyltransferase
MLPAYLRALRLHACGDLLDLGCGNVPLYGAYIDLVRDVTCIDWEESAHGSQHIDLAVDLNGRLPLNDGQFDTILSSDVLEHIWNHTSLWAEQARVLRSGGKLILGTPFLYRLHEAPHDYLRWTQYGLQRACEEAGLRVLELTATGGALDVLADISIKLMRVRSNLLAAGLSYLAEGFLRRGPLRRLSDASSNSMPSGYVLVAQKP